MSAVEEQARPQRQDARYILITQCLQNDLFLNPECRLALPEQVVRNMLMRKDRARERDDYGRIPPGTEVAEGPLGIFLDALLGRRREEEERRTRLDVVNIRDWHTPGAAYDLERRSYGMHCEGDSWGSEYLEGLDHLLDPVGDEPTEQVQPKDKGREVWVHHIFSDSVFDFKPWADEVPTGPAKLGASSLEQLLDQLIGDPTASMPAGPLYVAIVGVYTDIKVQTLLVGLRTRYNVTNLAVSDTLTASATLERHLAALDYAQKVLAVEVVHGVNDLVRFLGGTPPLENDTRTVAGDPFSRYSSFLQDKQNVLTYESEKLRDYLLLTERRAVDTFGLIKRANTFLIAWGSAFLLATLLLAVASALFPDAVRWELTLVTGGLSLLQLVSAFFSRPIRDLHQNLTNLAVFKMILESHSLKAALTRFHLTTPQTLREFHADDEAEAASRQVRLLDEQVSVIEEFDKVDYEALDRLGFRADLPAAGVQEPGANGGSASGEGQAEPATAQGS